jgi:hypothetical protein
MSEKEIEFLVCAQHQFYAYSKDVPCIFCKLDLLTKANERLKNQLFDCATDYHYIASTLGESHTLYAWLRYRKAVTEAGSGDCPSWKDFATKLMSFCEHAPMSSGVCCCGDSLEGHPSGFMAGHEPVDKAAYAISKFHEEFEKLNVKGKVNG